MLNVDSKTTSLGKRKTTRAKESYRRPEQKLDNHCLPPELSTF
jgi:hypothetical protein